MGPAPGTAARRRRRHAGLLPARSSAAKLSEVMELVERAARELEVGQRQLSTRKASAKAQQMTEVIASGPARETSQAAKEEESRNRALAVMREREVQKAAVEEKRDEERQAKLSEVMELVERAARELEVGQRQLSTRKENAKAQQMTEADFLQPLGGASSASAAMRTSLAGRCAATTGGAADAADRTLRCFWPVQALWVQAASRPRPATSATMVRPTGPPPWKRRGEARPRSLRPSRRPRGPPRAPWSSAL